MKKIIIVKTRKGEDGHIYSKLSNDTVGHLGNCPCYKKKKVKK